MVENRPWLTFMNHLILVLGMAVIISRSPMIP